MNRKTSRKALAKGKRANDPGRLALADAQTQLKAGYPPRTEACQAPSELAVDSTPSNGRRKKKKAEILEQWIEVTIEDGQTVTRLYPSNEKLLKYAQRLDPPPQRMVRRLNFPNGIPSEYDWTGVQDENHRRLGGLGLQRMTVKMWLDVIRREALSGSPHISPVLNLPSQIRECSCATCTGNRQLLEEMQEEAKAANRPFDLDSLLIPAGD